MRLDGACINKFAGHETFHPRYGWVKKSVDAAIKDPSLFNDDEAVIELGVGKNMVKSIRFWGLAYKVLSAEKIEGARGQNLFPSVIGRTLFADDGWDPFGEFSSTHWLLHWWLVAPVSQAPVWWLAFNEFSGIEFSDEQLTQFLVDRLRDWNPLRKAVEKDVSCFLRMYAGGSTSRIVFDDLIDCPSRELGLLTPGPERGTYRFVIGEKPTLSASVAAFACLDFVARTESSASTVNISRLATEPGSPGKAFKLTEPGLTNLLETASRQHKEIDVTVAAGVPQLTFKGSAAKAGTSLLFKHYKELVGDARPLKSEVLCGPEGSLPDESLQLARFSGSSR